MINKFEENKAYMYRGFMSTTLMFVKKIDSDFVTWDSIEVYGPKSKTSPNIGRYKESIDSKIIKVRLLSFSIMTQEDEKQIIHEIFQR